MARLRFPGRPGYRFGRNGVRYGVDQGQRSVDPTLELVANIHRGLRTFYDLFGESDEVNLAPCFVSTGHKFTYDHRITVRIAELYIDLSAKCCAIYENHRLIYSTIRLWH